MSRPTVIWLPGRHAALGDPSSIPPSPLLLNRGKGGYIAGNISLHSVPMLREGRRSCPEYLTTTD